MFTKLFHQITPYLILGGGTICDTVAAAAAAAAVVEQNTILRLDLILVVFGC